LAKVADEPTQRYLLALATGYETDADLIEAGLVPCVASQSSASEPMAVSYYGARHLPIPDRSISNLGKDSAASV